MVELRRWLLFVFCWSPHFCESGDSSGIVVDMSLSPYDSGAFYLDRFRRRLDDLSNAERTTLFVGVMLASPFRWFGPEHRRFVRRQMSPVSVLVVARCVPFEGCLSLLFAW